MTGYYTANELNNKRGEPLYNNKSFLFIIYLNINH